MTGQLTQWTIWGVLIAYAVTVGYFLKSPRGEPLPAMARGLWLIAALLLVAHALFAFAGDYQWSHQLALEQTAQRTKALTGLGRGEGLYLNYLMVLVWLADASWLILRPRGYQTRPRWINLLLHGFLLFMIVNGAIVFATGPVRWYSLGLLLLLAILMIDSRRRRGNIRS